MSHKFIVLRTGRMRQYKARLAANIENIGKGRNAVVVHSACSRRASPSRLLDKGAAIGLRPLAMFCCGPRLARSREGIAQYYELMGHDTNSNGLEVKHGGTQQVA